MFKIICILFLLLLLGGVVTRRLFRLFAMVILVSLLVMELGRLNICCFSSSCYSSRHCKSLTFVGESKKDIAISSPCVFDFVSPFGGKISIKGWDKPSAHIAWVRRAATQDDLKNIDVDVRIASEKGRSETVSVVVRDVRQAADKWFSFDSFDHSPCVDFEIFLPHSMLSAVIKTRSSSVCIDSMHVTKKFAIEARSGSVFVKDIQADVTIETRSGSVKASHIKGAVKAESKSGSIDLENIQGNVSTKARSGKIWAKNMSGSVTAIARSGSVNMDHVGGAVKAETRSGSITVFDSAGSVSAQAHSGSISVTRSAEAQGQVEASTRSGRVLIKDFRGNQLANGKGHFVIR